MERIVRAAEENPDREHVKLWIRPLKKPASPKQIPAGENCPGVVSDFTGFTAEPVKGVTEEIVDMAEREGGRLQAVDPGESQELIDATPELLTEDDLMETSAANQYQATRRKT